jgi:transglutaminase/protease-like cytokinesis protein 3
MKKCVFLFIFTAFCFKNSLSAQSVADLTRQITAEKTTDSAKVEAIYEWLIRNVNYDNSHKYRREGDTTLWQEPYNVVVLKKAVCMGYAKTFREMCRLIGVKAVVVEGKPKSPNGFVEREGHAWNAVQLNNNWYLLDATWDANGSNSEKKYFLTDPSVFIQNHWPQDPMWQLLTAPITYDCFAHKRDCATPLPYFNFNFSDTIRLWESLDTTQQLYNQSVRMQAFNPNDIWATRGLADYYSQQVTKHYAQYAAIRQAVTEKKRLPNGKDAVLKLLQNIENNLKSAQMQYEKMATFAKTGEYTDAHLNAETMAEMLKTLEKERAFVVQYFKN